MGRFGQICVVLESTDVHNHSRCRNGKIVEGVCCVCCEFGSHDCGYCCDGCEEERGEELFPGPHDAERKGGANHHPYPPQFILHRHHCLKERGAVDAMSCCRHCWTEQGWWAKGRGSDIPLRIVLPAECTAYYDSPTVPSLDPSCQPYLSSGAELPSRPYSMLESLRLRHAQTRGQGRYECVPQSRATLGFG